MIDSITNGYVYCQGIPEQWQTLAVYTTLTLLIDKPLADWYTDPLADSITDFGLHNVTIGKRLQLPKCVLASRIRLRVLCYTTHVLIYVL